MSLRAKVSTPLYITFLFIVILALFNGSMTSAATLYVVGELGGSAFLTSSYATTFYSLGNVLTMPLAVALGPAHGLKRIYLICLKLFLVASIFCGLSETYPLFIIGRLF